jgi:hypothetical protein
LKYDVAYGKLRILKEYKINFKLSCFCIRHKIFFFSLSPLLEEDGVEMEQTGHCKSIEEEMGWMLNIYIKKICADSIVLMFLTYSIVIYNIIYTIHISFVRLNQRWIFIFYSTIYSIFYYLYTYNFFFLYMNMIVVV